MAANNNLSPLNLIVLKIHHPVGAVSASSDASEFQIVSSVHGVRQKFTNSQLFALVSPRVMAPVSEFLHSLGFGFGLICTTG